MPGSEGPLPRLTEALRDRYLIESELGQGGMATVYLAQDIKHDRKVAVKVLRSDLAAIIGAERFLAEIKTTANLQHPHILPLHDSGTVAGTVFYVMPFVPGESLRDRIAREKQLPIADAVRIATEVASALDYAHRQGVIHRDIKPENILLHDGRALVADFGIALAASRTDSGNRMTETGMSLGTPHYMSPEQALGERDLDARADVYALGCVLYEMLTGEPPFSGPTAQAIIAKVMSSTPEPITTLRKTVPDHVAMAVEVALQKLPADRFGSAQEFGAALSDGSGSHLFRSGSVASRHRPSPARRALPWVMATAGIIAAGYLGSHLNRPDRPAPVRFSFGLEGDEPEDDAPGSDGVSISPDGRTIVYAGLLQGGRVLYRRDLDAVASYPIAGTEGGFQPVISPDGKQVAFATGDGRLKRVSLEGGAPVSLITITTPIGMSWSSRYGLILGMPSYSDRIRLLSAVPEEGDTAARVIRSGLDSTMHHDPIVVDDGRAALFSDIRWGTLGGGPTLGIMSLDDGTVIRTELALWSVAGLADGILVYFGMDRSLMAVRFDLAGRSVIGDPIRIDEVAGRPSGETAVTRGLRGVALSPTGTLVIRRAPGAFQAVMVDMQGTARPVLPDTIPFLNPRFSPDGRKAVMTTQLRNRRGTWLYDLASGTLSTVATRQWDGFEWTRDGQQLIGSWFGREAVFAMRGDASDSLSVLFETGTLRVNSAAPSPDGKSVVIGTGTTAGEYDVYVRPIAGDGPPVPFAASRDNEVAPRFSPDGRWLAYVSDESGRYEVYVRPFPGPGPRVQVSGEGGGQPVWAPDGRRIYYRTGRAMMVSELSSPTAGGVMVTGRQKLFEGEFFGTGAAATSASYDVSPDGRSFLMAAALSGSRAEIEVWLNWLDELKARLDGR